ncbi:MAG: helix-turn-helix domain-containing protein [Verrucomicrobiales bacterium]|nr:helix-turn-helix domain-containing protein [Verrucomicrobiales bacterium]
MPIELNKHPYPSRLLTKTEVAKLIRKSTRTVEHWVNAGYLSSIRISHSVLFDYDQVIADLKKFETGSRK